jgi:hypothetical protein
VVQPIGIHASCPFAESASKLLWANESSVCDLCGPHSTLAAYRRAAGSILGLRHVAWVVLEVRWRRLGDCMSPPPLPRNLQLPPATTTASRLQPPSITGTHGGTASRHTGHGWHLPRSARCGCTLHGAAHRRVAPLGAQTQSAVWLEVGVQATAPGEPRVTPADLWLNDGLHPSRELVWGARHEPTCGPGRANAGHGWCDTWGVTGPLFRSVSTDSCRRVADR